MKTNPNHPINTEGGTYTNEHGHVYGGIGLTKREYFAALAMQGLATDKDLPLTNACEIAVRIADYLIAELNKDQKDE